MRNKVINMPYDHDKQIQEYRWTPYTSINKFGNKLPFNWKCPICQTETMIIDSAKNVPHKCSNERHCPVTLVFI